MGLALRRVVQFDEGQGLASFLGELAGADRRQAVASAHSGMEEKQFLSLVISEKLPELGAIQPEATNDLV